MIFLIIRFSLIVASIQLYLVSFLFFIFLFFLGVGGVGGVYSIDLIENVFFFFFWADCGSNWKCKQNQYIGLDAKFHPNHG